MGSLAQGKYIGEQNVNTYVLANTFGIAFSIKILSANTNSNAYTSIQYFHIAYVRSDHISQHHRLIYLFTFCSPIHSPCAAPGLPLSSFFPCSVFHRFRSYQNDDPQLFLIHFVFIVLDRPNKRRTTRPKPDYTHPSDWTQDRAADMKRTIWP